MDIRVVPLIFVLSLAQAGALAAPRSLTRIDVFPPGVHLETTRDHQSLVVQATYSDGVTKDVTARARFTLGNPSLVTRRRNVLRPAADGTTELTVKYDDRAVTIPVVVKESATDRAVSFKLDVIPALTRAGCNTGSCHGASRGKDGFRLSLFGYDPEGDYFRLTREVNGRRINLALIDDSLVLEKGAGRVFHTGGKLFEEGSELYRTIHRWLDAGAPRDPNEIASPVAVEIYPKGMVLDGEEASQQIVVRAKYSDDSDRDVTRLATFLSNNENSATVTPDGEVVAGARGEAFIMARFDAFTVGCRAIVLPEELEFTFPEVPENNYIDTLINDKLKKLRVTPSEPSTDEVFLRRAYLDIVGLLPTVEEYERFMGSKDPRKREKLVDELLGRKEFVELWVMHWAELLQIRSSNQVSYKAMLLYYNWLQDRLANNVPMSDMVRELLGANGGTFKNPATNYYQNETDTLKVAENVAQVFMGMRIQCAQCHNHPFDRWTQNDYYGFAAFFSQIGRKRGEDPRETIVFNRGGGEVKHPVTGRVMQPKFLGGAVPDVKAKDRRQVLAGWLASPENPYFAKNLANIVWAHFFGRGIIHEPDDVRVSNPPVNDELLRELGKRFTQYNYDFRKLVRDICTSRTYQLSSRTNSSNESDSRNFSHGAIRRLRAEVLLDCITQITETKNKFRGLPVGARAVQIADGSTSTYFLTTFGRASRETACSCEVVMEPNLSQALHLLNGDVVWQKIRSGRLVERRLAEKRPPEKIIEELYLRCLSRKPTGTELGRLKGFVEGEVDKREVLEDIFWSLLNSREFLFNH